MILLSNQLQAEIISNKRDYKGRFIILKLKIHDMMFTILNLYAPNKETEQLSFFADLTKILDKEVEPNSNLILGGDWNIVLETSTDKQGGNLDANAKKRVREKVTQLFMKYNLTDVWRTRHPKKA